MHCLRRALTALFAGMIVAIATVGVTAPAQAEPALQANATDSIQSDSGSEIGVQAASYRLENAATGRCLRASSSSGAVSTTTCSRTSSLQIWTLTYDGSRYQIKNFGNGWCLDGNSTSIYTHACNTGSNQDWIRQSSATYRFMNDATGKCLDSNSSGTVYPHSCNTGNNQKWYLFVP
jgi:serine/threonine-protein kinase